MQPLFGRIALTQDALGVHWTNASSDTMVKLMFSLRTLRLRANTDKFGLTRRELPRVLPRVRFRS